MMRLYPLLPLLTILLGLCAALLTVLLRARKSDLPPLRRKILTGLSAAAILILGIMLLSPGFTVREADRRNANVVILLDASSSMAAADLPGGKTRFDAGREVLEKLRNAPLSGCGKYVYLFHGKAIPADRGNLVETTIPNGNTNLKAAFDAMERDIGSANIGAVAVISDGLDQSGFSGTRAGYPVYAVKTGSALGKVRDLGIDTFKYPASIRAGEQLELEIPLLLNGYPEEKEAILTVESDGQREVAAKTTLTSGKTVTVPFRKTFPQSGLYLLTFSLNRLDGEASYLNNTREIVLEVKDNRLETLLCFPVLTTGFRPLIRMLQGKNHTALYKLRSGGWNVISSRKNTVFDRGFPSTADSLRGIDLVLLGSGNENDYTEQERKVLEQYVAAGGALVVPGGPDAFGQSRDLRWAAMMPVRSSNARFLEGSFRVQLPQGDAESPFARLVKTDALLRGVNAVERVKNGAEVLLWAQSDRKYPLIAAMPYGRGKVIAVLTNTLHLWGSGPERARNFRNFWEQLLVQAGEGRDDRMRIGVNTDTPPAGTRLEVTAALPAPEFKADAELLRPDGTRLRGPIRMHRDGAVWKARFDDLPEGRWILKVNADAKDRDEFNRYRMITVGDSAAENTELKLLDENFLKFCTRGHLYTPDEIPRLLQDINDGIRKNDRVREWYPVFETPWFLLTLFLLLTAQWMLRRRFDLF